MKKKQNLNGLFGQPDSLDHWICQSRSQATRTRSPEESLCRASDGVRRKGMVSTGKRVRDKLTHVSEAPSLRWNAQWPSSE